MTGGWLAGYTVAVAMVAGSFGALVMALLTGAGRADDWAEIRAQERRARVLDGIALKGRDS